MADTQSQELVYYSWVQLINEFLLQQLHYFPTTAVIEYEASIVITKYKTGRAANSKVFQA